jgi:hypothetical protein
MRRRSGWIIGGTVAAVVVAGGATALVWQSSTIPAPSSPAPAPVATTPAPAAERAQEKLDALLTTCAESTAIAPPEHCGIVIPWGTEFADVTGIRYRIEKVPALMLDDDSFTATGGVLVATVSGTGQDGATRTETYRTENWSVRGDIAITDDEVDIDIW